MTPHRCRSHSPRGHSQTVTVVVLATIIAGAIGFGLYMTLGGSGKDSDANLLHFWCTEMQKQFDIDETTLSEDAVHRLEMSDNTALLPNPETGKDTLLMMWDCPACKKPFMPDWLKTGRPVPHAKTVCPHCQTDLDQWDRDHRPSAR